MAFRDALGRFRAPGVLEGFLADVEQGWEWTPVISSNVAEVGYNAATNTLGVRFLNGSEYNYQDVEQDMYYALVSAPSVGKLLHAEVKGAYAYQRVS